MKVTSTSYLPLVKALLEDLHEQCSTSGCSRDVKTISLRVKHEGMSFLTITLPTFCDAVFECIEKGFVDSTDFVGWKKRGCLPAFLLGFTSQVFDQSTGRRLADEKTSAIRAIRQVGYFFKKIKLPCTPEREAKGFTDYIAIERDLKRHILDYSSTIAFEKVARIVFSTVFPSRIDMDSFIPYHGPGSTAESITGNKKFDPINFLWPQQLSDCFERGLCIFPSEEYELMGHDNTTDASLSVEVISVPKTLSKPRIIAKEPTAMQMAQQPVKDFMVERLEACSLTRGHINFSDQSVNKRLALENSRTKKLATIDLAAASDRVLNRLVQLGASANKDLCCLIQTTRSKKAHVLGCELELTKFASMGSALCFPIEAMIFYCLLLTNRIVQSKSPHDITLRRLQREKKDIYVYGDDILIPVHEVDSACHFLSQFGLKVSRSKSFWKSPFRESCGMDAYAGENITPVYMRSPLTSGKVRPSGIISHVSTSNQLRANCLDRTAGVLKAVVERQVGNLPSVSECTEGLGWVDYKANGKRRYNRNSQRLEVQTLVPSISFKKDEIDGAPALLKCLLRLEDKKTLHNWDWLDADDRLYREALISDKEHLSRTPRRGALTLKRRWVSLL